MAEDIGGAPGGAMMIAFTLCSNNYLAYAAVLADSVKRHQPDCRFVLGLVDRTLETLDYSRYGFDEVIPVGALGIAGLDRMAAQYNIVELNTAVKPFYFSHLFGKSAEGDRVIYFDPDIEVYARLLPVERAFETSRVVLIPHFSTPHTDTADPRLVTSELKILQRGLYNLGFIGIENCETGRALAKWWESRLRWGGYANTARGMYTDQKWIDLVPLYFDGVSILRNSRCDVAYWNLYEYRLSMRDGVVQADGEPLIFYHFSAFKPRDPRYLESLAARFDPETAAALRTLYQGYRSRLMQRDFESLRDVPCAYATPAPLRVRVRRTAKAWLARRA